MRCPPSGIANGVFWTIASSATFFCIVAQFLSDHGESARYRAGFPEA